MITVYHSTVNEGVAVLIARPAFTVIVTVLNPLGVVGPFPPHPSLAARIPTDATVKSVKTNQ
jgi:hypothetical protein